MFLLIISAIILFTVYVINSARKPPNFPPGPPWLPITGSLSELKALSKFMGGQHKALSELSRKYNTNVLGLKLGKDLVVVGFSYPIVRTILKEDVYEGRPNNFFIRLRSMGTVKGITCTDGELWSTQRNFLVRHLRNLGYGKQTMEAMIQEELVDVLKIIEKSGPHIQIGRLIAPSVLNVLWALTAGCHISRHGHRLNGLLKLLRERSKAFDMSGGILTTFPWLRYIAPEKTGYNLIVTMNKELKMFFEEIIAEHHKNWEKDRNDDIIYAFISEMKRTDKNDSTFTDDQLLMVCADIFIAGSQTTSYTLDFAFLMMLLHPGTQKKVHDCLDKVLGKSDVLEYSDRYKVPYVEAVLLETERYCHVAPITGPRRVLADTVLDGYNIPKDTTVLISNYSVHMDKEFWGDPEVFRPERFLDENGQLIITDRLIPFGLGKRRCLGESLAKSCVFLFFANILRKYLISPVPDKPMPTGVPIPGIILSPEKYSVNFISRN